MTARSKWERVKAPIYFDSRRMILGKKNVVIPAATGGSVAEAMVYVHGED